MQSGLAKTMRDNNQKNPMNLIFLDFGDVMDTACYGHVLHPRYLAKSAAKAFCISAFIFSSSIFITAFSG